MGSLLPSKPDVITESGPTLVFHTYFTVPIVSNALHNLYHWVRIRLDEPINKWIVLLEPQEVDTILWDCYTLPNCDVQVIPEHYYNVYACEKISWYLEQFPKPGKIVLIAKNGDFSALWKYRIRGWKIILVHPPGLSWGLQQMAQEHFLLPVSLGPSGHEELNGLLTTTRQTSPELSIRFMKPLDNTKLKESLDNFGIDSTIGSGDASLSSFKDFLQYTLPTTIAERNLTEIFKGMQNCGRRPRHFVYPEPESFQVLGEPIKPPVGREGRKQEKCQRNPAKFEYHQRKDKS